jgi:hypothetical protein
MENIRGYSAKIGYASKQLEIKEKIQIKDVSNHKPLDQEPENLVIDLDYFAVIEVHNEKSENKDYIVIVIADKNGTKYSTSSQTFYNTLSDLYDECIDNDLTEIQIKVLKKESKNYKGKQFLTCTLY